MKLAHLILAHSNVSQLERLVKKLSNNYSDIYIHIDKKTDIQPFLILNKLSNVFFVEKREKVYWGAYSIVQATINGFETILKSEKNYDYVNLLSGQDYPLKRPEEIADFLEANPGKAFMEYADVFEVWKEAIPRITEYHLTNFHFPGRYLAQKWINKIMPKRKLPNAFIAVGRSQWFTITKAHVSYITGFLNGHPNIRNYFRFTWGPDEFVFQTILFNSPHKDDMVNNNLRYIDWSAGGVSPKTFSSEDAEVLFNSGKLFARKFSGELNNPLLTIIDERQQVK